MQRSSGFFVAFLFVVFLVSADNSANGVEDRKSLGWSKTKPAKGRWVKTKDGYMVPYSMKIPGTDVSFEMMPVPGGKFLMGSPKNEPGRKDHEGPRVEIGVAPFWMGKHEVTWKEYDEFMNLYDSFKEFVMLRSILASRKDDPGTIKRKAKLRELLKKFAALDKKLHEKVVAAEAVTAPTKIYEPDTTYEYGDEPDQPAVTMSQYGAKHYTKWLSKTSGIEHRLPTEAEWEYACRAGTKTAYSFGDDPEKLGQYAWFYDNGDEMLHEVGTKKPNPWGLHDMHGSVAEWVLDELSADGYQRLAGKSVRADQAVNWPTKLFPRVVRGGSWDADAEDCRSASRMGSHDTDWRSEDPNLPLSPWWFTTEPSHGVGFRLMRSTRPLTSAEKKKVWEFDVEEIQRDVTIRLEEGRGIEDNVGLDLPTAIRELQQVKKILKLEQN